MEKRKTKKQLAAKNRSQIDIFFKRKVKYQRSASDSDPDDPKIPDTKDTVTESKINSKINRNPKNKTDNSKKNTKLEETTGEEISDEESDAASANKLKISHKTIITENKKKDVKEKDVNTESEYKTDNVKNSEKGRTNIKQSFEAASVNKLKISNKSVITENKKKDKEKEM